MKVLVTGHQGYIGTVMVPMLLEAGHEVVGLDSGLFEPCLLANHPPAGDIETLQRDLRDVEARHFAGFDAVVHLAGLSNDPLGNLSEGLTADINDSGSVRLAQLAKQAGVSRFLFSSSCSTYGAAGDDFLDEDAAFNPVTPYGVSKVKMEEALGAMADDHFTPTYLRNATAYGVSPRLRLDLVLNNLMGWAVTTGKIHLLSDGTPWRPIVHIEDISRAFLAVLAAPREAVHNRAFNVGRSEENFRVSELAQIVREIVPGSEVTYAEGAGPDKRCYRVSCDRIRRELPAFEPRWDARRGAQQLYDAYRLAGLTKEEMEGGRFIRLAHIRELLTSGAITSDLRWQDSSSLVPA